MVEDHFTVYVSDEFLYMFTLSARLVSMLGFYSYECVMHYDARKRRKVSNPRIDAGNGLETLGNAFPVNALLETRWKRAYPKPETSLCN